MYALNESIFLQVNGPAAPPAWIVTLADLLAASPLVVAPLVLAALWIWGEPAHRGVLLATAGAMLLGQGVNLTLGGLWFEPRPFMAGVGHTLMFHAPDNAFPSDHMTFIMTCGLGLLLSGAYRAIGALVCLLGCGVAWARLYLGVHFPIDMFASSLVALLCGSFAVWVAPSVESMLMPGVNRLYAVIAQRLPRLSSGKRSRR